MPWVSIIEDAKESLLRSHWDLVIVDEAHGGCAYSQDHKTMAYQLGEALSDRTDHFLHDRDPHKGDPANFSLFLRLLDKDVYADIKEPGRGDEEAYEAPFYLRRVKEAMVTYPRILTPARSRAFSREGWSGQLSSKSTVTNGICTIRWPSMFRSSQLRLQRMTPPEAELSALPWPCCKGRFCPASMP